MRQVQINRNLILREDGKLFNVHTGEEFIPKAQYGTRATRYLRVRVRNKNWRLHQLVMKFFGPPKPGENYEIDHIDRNTQNNNITNLRWVTRQENANNRKTSLPVGQRRCDMPLNEYYRQRKKIYKAKKKEGD